MRRPSPASPSQNSSPSATSTSSVLKPFATRFGARPFDDVEADARRKAGSTSFASPRRIRCTPTPAIAAASRRRARARRKAAGREPCRLRRDARRRARGHHTKLGVISQRRWYEPVRRMKDAIDAGKIGRPVLGTFTMYSWRDPAYYRSDPWRGRWDTEGGGVLVNQSPHMLDLLLWLMDDDVAEVSGYWANLNHPTVEVEDSAVAILRFRRGGLGSIVASLSQKPGIHTKVHIHGSSGASVGVETDRGATFIAGVSAISEPPLNDMWTIPGEELQLPLLPGRRPCPIPDNRCGLPLPRPANP